MKATITSINKIITGKTLKQLQATMTRMLKVDGPRALKANVNTGAEIYVSLYDGEGYIRTASGNVIK